MRLRAVILLLSLAGLALAQPYRIPPSASGGVWGQIIGDINAQSDLIAAIAAGGNPGFAALLSGTNSQAAMVCTTGCSMSTAGTGTIDANSLGGVLLSGLATGLLKNTGGVPSIGVAGVDYALPSNPGYQPSQVLSGCAIEYISGLTYSVGQCTYTINGSTYTSQLASVTLATADPTNPRIDVIGVDTSGAPFVTSGTPSTPAAQPAITALQLGLSIAYVPAGSSTPQGVTVGDIYEENTEWTSAVTANFNSASTNNPYRGSKDIEATTAVLTNSVTLVKPAAGTENLSAWNTLSFYIRSKAAWPTGNGANAARWVSVYWLNGSTQVGSLVQVRDGVFGFNSSSTSAYQQISIPVSLFATGASAVTSLRFQVTGNGGSTSIGFYLDAITLQGGTNGIALPATLMNFRGAYNTTTAYNPNDTVTSGGIGYVALAANTNVALSVAATWAPISLPTHSFTCNIGSPTGTTVITTGDTGCYSDSGSFAVNTITRADVIGNAAALAACSITVDLWLINSTTAYPTSSDKISASAPATLASAKANKNFARTGWSASTFASPTWGASVASVTGCVYAQVRVEFQ